MQREAPGRALKARVGAGACLPATERLLLAPAAVPVQGQLRAAQLQKGTGAERRPPPHLRQADAGVGRDVVQPAAERDQVLKHAHPLVRILLVLLVALRGGNVSTEVPTSFRGVQRVPPRPLPPARPNRTRHAVAPASAATPPLPRSGRSTRPPCGRTARP